MKFDSALPEGKHRPIPLRGDVSFIPRPDIFQALSSRSVAIIAPEENQDDGVTVELTAVGAWRRDRDEELPLDIAVGDIVWTNARFAARRIKVDGVNHWMLHQSLVLGKVIDMSTPCPIAPGDNIITRPAPKWMQFALTGSREVQRDGLPLITIADGLDGEEGVATDNDRDPSRATYEEVVAVGPLYDDVAQVGDLVAVTKQRTATNITVRGEKFTLVPPNNQSTVIMRAADRPEWTR